MLLFVMYLKWILPHPWSFVFQNIYSGHFQTFKKSQNQFSFFLRNGQKEDRGWFLLWLKKDKLLFWNLAYSSGICQVLLCLTLSPFQSWSTVMVHAGIRPVTHRVLQGDAVVTCSEVKASFEMVGNALIIFPCSLCLWPSLIGGPSMLWATRPNGSLFWR